MKTVFMLCFLISTKDGVDKCKRQKLQFVYKQRSKTAYNRNY